MDWKSVSGCAVFAGDSLVVWHSRRQKCVALSTMEAEMIAICKGIKLVSWIKQFYSELGIKIMKTIYCDNQATIKVLEGQKAYARVKHIDLRYYYVKNKISESDTKIEYVYSKENVADIFTKPLLLESFNSCRNKLRIMK